MNIKTFILKVECADATRFDFDDSRLCRELEFCADQLCRVVSTGPVPRVTVLMDEAPKNQIPIGSRECSCPICAETRQPQPVRG